MAVPGLADSFLELNDGEWLEEHVQNLELLFSVGQLVGLSSGHQNDRKIVGGEFLSHHLQKIKSMEARHHQDQNHEVIALGLDDLQSVVASGQRVHGIQLPQRVSAEP